MIVVDASVAVKWFVPEADHSVALALLEADRSLAAPDLVLAETMHALRKKLRAKDVTEQQYAEASVELPSYFDHVVPTSSLLKEAAQLSILPDHGFYDCVYLALALTTGGHLVTADEVFRAKARDKGFNRAISHLSVSLYDNQA